MAGAISDYGGGLAAIVGVRRHDLRQRALYALICAAALGPIVGWGLAAAWLLIYAGLQGLEGGLSDAPLRPSRKAVLGLIALDSAIYGALPLAALLDGRSWSTLCGALFLAGAMLGAGPRYAGSRIAYVAATAPFGLYLLVAAGLAGRQSGDYGSALAAAAAGALLVVAAARQWRSVVDSQEAQRRIRGEAERRKREAEAAAGAKQAFVAAVSQELRAPISAILAGAEAIERGGTDPAAHANAGLIAQSGRALRALLADLSDLAALESGRLGLETTAFDPRALVNETLRAWTGVARRKALHLRLDGAEALPERGLGDPARLRQVLDTLIGHALGATDQGGVTLSVLAARLEAGESKEYEEKDWLVRFSIADTGAAFTAEQRQHLFAPLDPPAGREPRARPAALGLTVCREIARLMAGDLYPGGGADGHARFTLEVALAAAPAGAPRLGRPDARLDLRALVVDDHEMNRRAVALMLEPQGVRLTTASSAQAALEILASTPFDLVLMDVDMPLMDGREACQRLRAARGVNQSTPVIACVSSTGQAELEACRKAGMTAFVAKPLEAPALYAAIERALKTRRSGRAAAA